MFVLTTQAAPQVQKIKKSFFGLPSMLSFGVLPDVKLLVSLLVGKSAAVELGDGPQPGQDHQSQGQEGQSHG